MVDCGTRARHVRGGVAIAEGLRHSYTGLAQGPDLVFGAREIGHLLGVPRRMVYSLAAKRGPIFKIGSRLAARRSALTEFLENLEKKAAA